VQGNSTAETKAPNNITLGIVAFDAMPPSFFDIAAGIVKDQPLPYQKKSLISKTPANIIKVPTPIDKYSVMIKGMLENKKTKPNPAIRYTANTENIYKLPRRSILLIDDFEANNTEIINIKTPMAQGLIESINPVVTTIPNVGRYASTAN